MSKRQIVRHEFVEFIPKTLEDGVVYVSIPYATVVHSCLCGCGAEVVTPLAPRQWHLAFDGKTISLDPSIGNWSFACQSHYWITNDRVQWAAQWSQERIAAGRARTRAELLDDLGSAPAEPTHEGLAQSRAGWIARLFKRRGAH